MNDKQMIEKIRTTFTGPDHTDNAVQHYENARKTMLLNEAYQSVLRFLNNDVEYFKQSIRDDIVKIEVSSRLWCIDVKYTLVSKWSIKTTKWPDGYEVRIHKPDGKILNSECGLDFEDARKMVEEWEYETNNS